MCQRGLIRKTYHQITVFSFTFLYNPTDFFTLESNLQNSIYICDESMLKRQIHFIENCPVLKNVIIPMTLTRILKEDKPGSYLILKRMIETEVLRKFFVFANEFFTETFVPFESLEKSVQRDFESVIKVAEWYTNYLRFTEVELVFLTNDRRSYLEAQRRKIKSLTVLEFVEQRC